MTLGKAAKGVYTKYCGTYRIGFSDPDGSLDETEFKHIKSLSELLERWIDFCVENSFSTSGITYLVRS